MSPTRPAFPEPLRDRILRRDASALEDVDQFLRVLLFMDDERRQHVLVWLDRAMHDAKRLDGLRDIRDLGRYFVGIGRRQDWILKRRGLFRALKEAAHARERSAATERGLNAHEMVELVVLVRERVSHHCEFDAEVFVCVVFEGRSYEAVAAELRPRFGETSLDQLRSCVTRTRAELRLSLAWYLNIGASDFITESRGALP